MHVAQLHALRNRIDATARIELGVEIRIGQAEVLELEHFRNRSMHQAQADRCRRASGRDSSTPARVEKRHLALRMRRAAGSRWCWRCRRELRARVSPVLRESVRARFRSQSRWPTDRSSRATSARPNSDRRETVRRGIRCKGHCPPPKAWSRAKLEVSRSLRSQVPVRKEKDLIQAIQKRPVV